MFLVKKNFRFCAAHRLASPSLSDEENQRIYGKCASPNFHGHTYELKVTIQAPMNPKTAMAMDFFEIEHLVKQEIVDHVDHKNLNLDVPFLQGLVPTAEILLQQFWQILAPEFQTRGVQLHSLTLKESRDNVVVYFGEQTTQHQEE